ncbi:MAG: GerW family sporulation protein [Oscillospiraceae bacterium]|nr:GerW family sporulation protein [Oscillospiraceae bacterium]
MDKRPISELMETTMQKVKEMVDANTIVGEAIVTQDGVTLIPVSKLTFGFAGGGSDIPKKQDSSDAFGGGIGAGVNIIPVAFLVVKDDSIKLLHVAPPAETTLDRLIETVPEVFDKVTDFVNKRKEDKDEDDD